MRAGTLLRIVLLAALGLAGAPRAMHAQNPASGQEQSPPGEGGRQRGHFRGNAVFGRIQSISPTEMKLEAPDGSTVTVHISEKTQFRMEQAAAKPEDFKAGTPVFVRGTKREDSSWDAELIAARNGPPPMTQGMGRNLLAGTVKSVEGTKITIVKLDGTTETMEADENTSLRKHRESITLADIHPGDGVAVRGETKDGVFVPRVVNVMDAAQFERMKQFLSSGGAAGGPPQQGDKKPESKPQGPR